MLKISSIIIIDIIVYVDMDVENLRVEKLRPNDFLRSLLRLYSRTNVPVTFEIRYLLRIFQQTAMIGY